MNKYTLKSFLIFALFSFSLFANASPFSQLEQDPDGRSYIFIGEEHHENFHLENLLQEIRNKSSKLSKVKNIFLEYFLDGDSPEGLQESSIQQYLKKRRFNWTPERANQLFLLSETCKSLGIRVWGVDKEKPRSFKGPIFLWRISKELHESWINSIKKNSPSNDLILIYGGKLHGRLLKKNGLKVNSFIFDKIAGKYKKEI